MSSFIYDDKTTNLSGRTDVSASLALLVSLPCIRTTRTTRTYLGQSRKKRVFSQILGLFLGRPVSGLITTRSKYTLDPKL